MTINCTLISVYVFCIKERACYRCCRERACYRRACYACYRSFKFVCNHTALLIIAKRFREK